GGSTALATLRGKSRPAAGCTFTASGATGGAAGRASFELRAIAAPTARRKTATGSPTTRKARKLLASESFCDLKLTLSSGPGAPPLAAVSSGCCHNLASVVLMGHGIEVAAAGDDCQRLLAGIRNYLGPIARGCAHRLIGSDIVRVGLAGGG